VPVVTIEVPELGNRCHLVHDGARCPAAGRAHLAVLPLGVPGHRRGGLLARFGREVVVVDDDWSRAESAGLGIDRAA
jgi:hypothetical protein